MQFFYAQFVHFYNNITVLADFLKYIHCSVLLLYMFAANLKRWRCSNVAEPEALSVISLCCATSHTTWLGCGTRGVEPDSILILYLCCIIQGSKEDKPIHYLWVQYPVLQYSTVHDNDHNNWCMRNILNMIETSNLHVFVLCHMALKRTAKYDTQLSPWDDAVPYNHRQHSIGPKGCSIVYFCSFLKTYCTVLYHQYF